MFNSSEPRSTTFFHFTKSRETLEAIVENGFWPRYCRESLHWLEKREYQKVAYPMVCFCDIPLSRARSHSERYGSYAIGMNYYWGIKAGLNPVAYMADGSPFHESVVRLLQTYPGTPEGWIDIRKIMSMIKPVTEFVRDPSSRQIQPMNFYQENEWRFIPNEGQFAAHLLSEYENKPGVEEMFNSMTREQAMLEFGAEDINFILVEQETDEPALVKKIGHCFTDEADVAKVASKISSIENLEKVF